MLKHDSYSEPGWEPRSRDDHLSSLHIWLGHVERRQAEGRPIDTDLWQALHEAKAIVEHLQAEYDAARPART